jgi:hypothetical protein
MLKNFVVGVMVAGLCVLALGGCARTARDTTGFAIARSISVPAPFEDTWQAAKSVLREQDYDLYTRDKRGTFVAYTQMNRRLMLFTPHRTKYTIELEAVSASETAVHIETVRQVYGVTLLTYPDWHDRKADDDAGAVAILEAIQAKLGSATLAPAQAPEESPAPPPDLVEAAPLES